MDIVERLRVQWSAMGDMANAERLEAADEIERLRWENSNMEKLWGKSEGTWMGIRDKQELEIERLREALKDIVPYINEWEQFHIDENGVKHVSNIVKEIAEGVGAKIAAILAP